MTNLISELTNYSNNLSMQVKPYFQAGLTSERALLLFNTANFGWVTNETTIEELIQDFESKIKEKSKSKSKSKFSLKAWFIKKYVIYIEVVTMAKVVIKNAKTWGVNIEAEQAIFAFYLGIILQVQKER